MFFSSVVFLLTSESIATVLGVCRLELFAVMKLQSCYVDWKTVRVCIHKVVSGKMGVISIWGEQSF